MAVPHSVIIHNLNIFRSSGRPTKAEAELIIDSNAVLPGPVTFERFQSISRRHSQILQLGRDLQLPQLAPSHDGNVHKPPNWPTFRKRFCVSAFD